MEVKERFVESEGHRLACLVVNEHLDSQEQPCIVCIRFIKHRSLRKCIIDNLFEFYGRSWSIVVNDETLNVVPGAHAHSVVCIPAINTTLSK